MTGFGAIVKSVSRWAEGMVWTAGRALRLGLPDRRLRLCPVRESAVHGRRR